MNRKPAIIIVSLAGIVVIIFMIWSAIAARRKSNEIMEEFKKVNESLDYSPDTLYKSNDTLHAKFDSTVRKDSNK